ncbi:biopolymer transporter ExbD [bacterium]|nr:biopolymer transporter ExbD [bacterium]
MAKIKKHRVGVNLDMTPMVDVAFLLLTFFMLATTFRPPEEVSVTVPDSHSQLKLPVANVITLSITKEKRIWMDVDAQVVRAKIFGVDYAQKAGKEITIDELASLINKARLENLAIRGAQGAMRVVIKADKDADYDVVSDIIDILQKTKITTVNFITNLER